MTRKRSIRKNRKLYKLRTKMKRSKMKRSKMKGSKMKRSKMKRSKMKRSKMKRSKRRQPGGGVFGRKGKLYHESARGDLQNIDSQTERAGLALDKRRESYTNLRNLAVNLDIDSNIDIFKRKYEEAKRLWEANKGGWFTFGMSTDRRVNLEHALSLLDFVETDDTSKLSSIDTLIKTMDTTNNVKVGNLKKIKREAKELRDKIRRKVSSSTKKTLKTLKSGITKLETLLQTQENEVPKLVTYEKILVELRKLVDYLQGGKGTDDALNKIKQYTKDYKQLKLELRIVKDDKSFKYHKLLEKVESILDSLDVIGKFNIQKLFIEGQPSSGTEPPSGTESSADVYTSSGRLNLHEEADTINFQQVKKKEGEQGNTAERKDEYLTLGKKCKDTCELLESLLPGEGNKDDFKTLLTNASLEWKDQYIENETKGVTSSIQQIQDENTEMARIVTEATEQHNRRLIKIENIHILLKIRYRQVLLIVGDLTHDDLYYKQCVEGTTDPPSVEVRDKLSGPEIVESLYPQYCQSRLYPFKGELSKGDLSKGSNVPPTDLVTEVINVPPTDLVTEVIKYNIRRSKNDKSN